MDEIKPFKIEDGDPEAIFLRDVELAVKKGVSEPLSMPYFKKGGPDGVMLIHGFCSSPWEMLPVARALEEEGFTVYAARVAGHGANMDALIKTGWADWYESLAAPYSALSRSCRSVTVIGQSNGGLLACAAAMRNKVSALGLLAPAFKVRVPGFPLVKYLRYAIKYIPRKLKDWEKPYNYPGFPVKSLYDMKLLQNIVNGSAENISVPVMLGISRSDILVSPEKAVDIFSGMASVDKTLHIYDNKTMKIQHILTLPRMERVREDIVKWVKRVSV